MGFVFLRLNEILAGGSALADEPAQFTDRDNHAVPAAAGLDVTRLDVPAKRASKPGSALCPTGSATWIYPFFIDRLLADVNNRTMKELVEFMAPKLSAASIRDYVNIVKGVVASAINDDGEEVFPRNWNEEFIDAPLIKNQRQPSTTTEGMNAIVNAAEGRYRMLYALLAGCGPLRAGEALGIEIDKHISDDCPTLFIRQKAKRGVIQPFLKTKNGAREVDLCLSLAKQLQAFIGKRTSGLLFQTASGAQVLQSNILRDSLHPILEDLEHEKGGFNIFRRYRITYLKKLDCPEALQHFWSGHAQKHVSERYTKLNDRQYRLDWAEKVGLGFSVVLPMPPRVVSSAA